MLDLHPIENRWIEVNVLAWVDPRDMDDFAHVFRAFFECLVRGRGFKTTLSNAQFLLLNLNVFYQSILLSEALSLSPSALPVFISNGWSGELTRRKTAFPQFPNKARVCLEEENSSFGSKRKGL